MEKISLCARLLYSMLCCIKWLLVMDVVVKYGGYDMVVIMWWLNIINAIRCCGFVAHFVYDAILTQVFTFPEKKSLKKYYDTFLKIL